MKNNYFILIVLGLVIFSALALKLFTPSNLWVCQDGQWVKHGNPKTEKPNTACSDPFSMEQEMIEMTAMFNKYEKERAAANLAAEEDLNLKLKEAGLSEPIVDAEELVVEPALSTIELLAPKPGKTIQSPYQIRGFARGSWYFEGSFPVILKDINGVVISETYAQAQSDWMTDEMVPFVSQLEYLIDSPQEAVLILRKDNPSGLVELDEEISFSIILN